MASATNPATIQSQDQHDSSALSSEQGRDEQRTWRERAFISELPSDFLCPEGVQSPVGPTPAPTPLGQNVAPLSAPVNVSQQEELDRQAALALQRHYVTQRPAAMQTATGRLNLTIAQAKLTKNYGLARMDPYVRLRLGHCVYETQTCYNGATNPRWNKAVMCYVPHGVTTLNLEVFDECSFTDDSLVAYATIQIPAVVLTGGETSDDWHPLSGKQGDGREGMINLIMNYTPLSAEMALPAGGTVPLMMAPQMMAPQMMAPHSLVGLLPAVGVPAYTTALPRQPPPQQAPPPLQQQDVTQLKEMFPALDDEIIRSVLEARGRDKAAAISSLLELTET